MNLRLEFIVAFSDCGVPLISHMTSVMDVTGFADEINVADS